MNHAITKTKDRTTGRIPLYYAILANFTKNEGKLLRPTRNEGKGKRANSAEYKVSVR